MNTKNFLIGVTSFLLASGAAATALWDDAPNYIHVRYNGDVNFTCTSVTSQCMGGTMICTVTVAADDAQRTTPVYDNQANTTTCTLRLTGGSLEKVTKRRIMDVDPL